MKKSLRVLFIGNSHTYYNDLPAIVASMLHQDGISCEVTMLAHGGWFLAQHAEEPQTRFNILYGHYDYVVLQEHAHPFGPEEKFFDAVRKLDALIKEAGIRTVIYSTWAKKEEEFNQARMNAAHKQIAEDTGALLAPVGEYWWGYMRSWPNVEMYAEDGAHASPQGSRFAAKYIRDAILTDVHRREREKAGTF